MSTMVKLIKKEDVVSTKFITSISDLLKELENKLVEIQNDLSLSLFEKKVKAKSLEKELRVKLLQLMKEF